MLSQNPYILCPLARDCLNSFYKYLNKFEHFINYEIPLVQINYLHKNEVQKYGVSKVKEIDRMTDFLLINAKIIKMWLK